MTEKIATSQLEASSPSRASIRVLDSRWFGFILRILQILLWWPFIKICWLFLVKKSWVDPNFKTKPNTVYVVAANHQSAFDHFMILCTLPFSAFVSGTPFRFMTLAKFFSKLGLRIFLILCGAFPAKPIHTHVYGIEAAERFIKMRQSVLIFPEGTRTLPRQAEPKNGVTILAKMPDVEIIPARVMWYKNSHLNRSCHVSIGQPFDARHLTAQEIMDHIYSLPQ